MIDPRRIAFTAVTLCVVVSKPPGASARDSLDEFMKDYLPAVTRLEEAYYRLRIVERQLAVPGFRGPNAREVRTQWLPRGRGLECRVDILDADRNPIQSRLCLAGGPSFQIDSADSKSIPPGQPAYHYSQIIPPENAPGFWARTVDLTHLASLPYNSIYTTPRRRIDRYISDPAQKVTVLRYTRYLSGGTPLAKLEYTREVKGVACAGHYVFSPEQGWAMLEYADDGPLRSRIKLEYDGVVEGVPVASKAVLSTLSFGPDPYLTIERVGYQVGPAPDDAFSPAVFGLPEIKTPGRPFPVLLSCSAAAIVLSLLVIFSARRRVRV